MVGMKTWRDQSCVITIRTVVSSLGMGALSTYILTPGIVITMTMMGEWLSSPLPSWWKWYDNSVKQCQHCFICEDEKVTRVEVDNWTPHLWDYCHHHYNGWHWWEGVGVRGWRGHLHRRGPKKYEIWRVEHLGHAEKKVQNLIQLAQLFITRYWVRTAMVRSWRNWVRQHHLYCNQGHNLDHHQGGLVRE